MGRLGITYDQIAQAAENILADGENPTIDKVRRLLGDTGSNSNISRYLREWKTKRMQGASSPLQPRADMPDSLTRAVADMWEKIREESDSENTRIRETAESTVTQIQELNAALQEKLTTVQATLEKTQLTLNHLQADYQLSQQTLIEERQKNAVLIERIKHAEETNQKAQIETQQRLVEQQQSNEAMVSHLKNEIAELQKQHQHAFSDLKEQTEKQRQTLIVEIDQLRVSKQKAETAHLKSATELAQQQKNNAEMKEQVKSVETDLKVLEQTYQTLKQDYEKVDKHLLVANTENQQKDLMLVNLKEQLTVLTQQLMTQASSQSHQK